MRIAVIAFLATGILGCASSPSPQALAKAQGTLIARDTVLIPGRFVSGRQPDGNSVVLHARDGLIVFDSGRHAEHTQRILDYAHDSGQPIVAVVNSHWHLDHVSGNPRLRAAYPQLQVHASRAIEGALSGFLADSRKQAQELIAKGAIPEAQLADVRGDMATIEAGEKLLPDRAITEPGERTIAGRRLRLGLARDAVTGGDVWVFDPRTRVLLAGDLVTLPVPLFDTACASHWRTELAALEKTDFATLVPGHGAPLDRVQFHRYRVAFDNLLTCTAGREGNATCIDGWLSDAGDLVAPMDHALARGLLDYYLGQVLRAPPARRDRYCPA